MRSAIWSTLKWTKRLIVSFFMLVVLVAIAVMLPPVQKYAIHLGTDWFEDKTGGSLQIEDIDLRLPYYINLKGVKLSDPSGSEIASIESIAISLGWRMIFNRTIRLDRIELQGFKGTITADTSGSWNYDFIAEAFADTIEVPKESTETSPFDISVGLVKVGDFNAIYSDALSQDSISLHISTLETAAKRFSVNQMVFLLSYLDFEGSETYIRMGASAPEPPSPKRADDTDQYTTLPTISLDELNFKEHHFSYTSANEDTKVILSMGELSAQNKQIDLSASIYEFESISLKNTQFKLETTQTAPLDTGDFDYDIFIPINLGVDELLSDNNDVRIVGTDLQGSTSTFELSEITFGVHELQIHPEGYQARLDGLNFTLNDLVDIDYMSVGISVERQKASLDQLKLNFGESSLNTSVEIGYANIGDLIEQSQFSTAVLDLSQLILMPADLNAIYDIAAIPDSSRLILPAALRAKSLIRSDGKYIDLERFNAALGQSTIDIAARSEGPELLKRDIEFTKIESTIFLSEFGTFLPDSMDLTPYPDRYMIAAEAFASPTQTRLNGILKTDIGDIDFNIGTGGWESDAYNLDGQISTLGLSLSKLAGLDSLYAILGIAFSVDDIASDERCGRISVVAEEIDYEKYQLNDVAVEIDIEGTRYSYFIESKDSSAVGTVLGSFDMSRAMHAEVEGDISGIDFEYLGITDTDYRAQIHFTGNGSFQVDSVLNAALEIDRAVVVREGERIDVKPIRAAISLLSDSSAIDLESEWLDLKGSSNLAFDDILIHVQSLLKDEADPDLPGDGYLQLTMKTGDAKFIEQFIPGLEKFEPSHASVLYNAATRRIKALASFPKIKYKTYSIDSISLGVEGSSGDIAGEFSLGRIAFDTLAVEGLVLKLGPAEQGKNLSFKIYNGTNTAQYDIGANILFAKGAEDANWIIDPFQEFILAGKTWSVSPEARVAIRDSVFGIENFVLSRNQNLLSIHSPMNVSHFKVMAKNFNLDYISSLFTSETPLLTGFLNLDMEINRDGTFEGRSDINNLAVLGLDFGRFDLSAESKRNVYNLQAQIEGPSADLEVKGTLKPTDANDAIADIDLFLTRFDFKSLKKLAPSAIIESSGIGTGKLKIEGTTSAPILNGAIFFKDISLKMVNNEARYTLKDERIVFAPNQISFPSFTIRDSTGNKMVINGKVDHNYFLNREYDLTISSENFTLLNILPGDDPFVYGKLIVGTDIDVSGDQNMPIIESDIRLKEGSEIVIQIPEEEYDDASFDGLVQWVSFNDEPVPTNSVLDVDKKKTPEPEKDEPAGLDLSGQLRIDPKTKLKIIIDPLAGDNLEIQGGGVLGLGFDKSGQLNLSGSYRVSSGIYEMTFYNIVKRSFVIDQGSTITWNGDVYNPEMRINAIYKTRIPLSSLMGSQGAEASANEALRRPADFELHMNLSGNLDKTDVGFEIKLAPESRGLLGGAADARLGQINQSETDLNRQVFAMLVLNTFVNDAAPTSGGEALATEARNSASQILTNQLNSLSDRFIGGAVDLNFDMLSYQGADGNAETDLNIDVSKSLFNDRVLIKVGSTVALEGSNNNAGANGNELITNIIVEYKISPDGRYNFKVFRKEDLDDILVGRLTRTGVGVMFRREFDTNQHIFRLTEAEQDLIKESAADREREKIEGKSKKKK